MKDAPYLSDEELLALIAVTEDAGLLHAPKDLKQTVVNEAAKIPAGKKPSRQTQFYSYCFRVGLATAASLAILLIPTPTQKETPDTLSLTQQLYLFTGDLEQRFSDLNQTFADFDFNLDFNFGGNRDE